MTQTIHTHSSFLGDAVYNEEKQSLRIQIGQVWYYYYGVTMQKIARFKKAQSKGKYYCKYIKGKYEMAKRSITKA